MMVINTTKKSNTQNKSAIYINQGSGWQLYYICRDYLGSITHLVNSNGTVVQELSYDAWGRLRNPVSQTVYETDNEPELMIRRGYTGHEHLPMFGLINMNARLYDPALGRFLSPDPYVQMSDFSQSYNRYSYCLNNPLVYVDENGEFLWVPVIIGAIIGAYTGGTIANHGQRNPTKWNYGSWQTWGYMFSGAIVGGISGYAGAAIATSGIPLANTASIAGSSLINSVGTWAYTGGQTPISISVGAFSYDFTNNKFGGLFGKGNKWYENLGYGLGSMANLQDGFTLFRGGGKNIDINSKHIPDERGDIWGHSSATYESVEKGGTKVNTLISVGPSTGVEITDDMGNKLSIPTKYKNSIKDAKVDWDTYYGEKGTWTVRLNNVSTTAMNKYAAGITRWDLGLNSCVGHTTRALWSAGIPNIYLFHPHFLNTQLFIRQLGIYSSPYLYQIP